MAVGADGAAKVESQIKALKTEAVKFGNAADSATKEAQSGFARLGSVVTSVASGIAKGAAIVGGAILAGATALTYFVMKTTETMDSTMKLSRSLGIGVEELQRLQHAAGMSGVATETLGAGMKFLNKQLLESEQGGASKFREALGQIGVSLDQLGGSRTEQIGVIADALNKVGDDSERSALAAQLFGKSAGPEMASLLAEGSEGIAKLAAETAGVFTAADGARAEDFQDTLQLVNEEISALGRTIVIELLPTFVDLAHGVHEWVKENAELIRQKIPEIIGDVVDSLKSAKDMLDSIMSMGGDSGFLDRLSFMLHDMAEDFRAIGHFFRGTSEDILEMARETRKLLKEVKDSRERTDEEKDQDAQQQVKLDKQTELYRKAYREAFGAAFYGPDYDPVGPGMSGGKPKGNEVDAHRIAAEAAQKAVELAASSEPGGWLASNAPLNETPDEYEKRIQKIFASIKRAESETKREGAAGRRADKAAAKAAAKAAEASGLTWDQAIAATAGGNTRAGVERLRGVSLNTPAADSIKPTVAMTLYITNNGPIDVTQNITGANPVEIGRESAKQFRSVLRNAGDAMPNTVLR